MLLQVTVRTSIANLRDYLEHLQQTTNMKCLTPDSALDGDCNFLAANLYARSVFGEDALANLSIELSVIKATGVSDKDEKASKLSKVRAADNV